MPIRYVLRSIAGWRHDRRQVQLHCGLLVMPPLAGARSMRLVRNPAGSARDSAERPSAQWLRCRAQAGRGERVEVAVALVRGCDGSLARTLVAVPWTPR